MSIRAIRGATQVAADTPDALKRGVQELIMELMKANNLQASDLISMLFTATPDLVSDFPAASARGLGLEAVPLICAVEIAVPGSLPRAIRVMVHCETPLEQREISHIYLHGAKSLRKDLAQ